MDLPTYLTTLRERLQGKDPRRLAGALVPRLDGKPAADIVFVFKEGKVPRHRLTVAIDGAAVTVREGAHVVEGRATMYVFTTLPDWLAFFEGAAADAMDRIDLLGDVSLLKVLPELFGQRLSPLQARLGG